VNEIQKKIMDLIDEEFLVRTTEELVEIPSPTGHEAEAAQFMVDRYREAGLEAHLQHISEGRGNAIGVWRGSGGGYSLMFNGHLDTSYTGKEPELVQAGYKNKAVRDGEWLIGNGTNNMKSAVVSHLAAVRALLQAGVSIRGDIVLTAVAGEIEKMPVGGYQGVDFDGYGAGTKYLLSHGYMTDFCILGEPTALRMALANGGTIWFKVTTYGSMGHTIFGDFTTSAIERMATIQKGLREWITNYQKRHEFLGEHPHVNVAAIEGGWPYRCARSPIECHLYVDVRLVPGQRIQDVQAEFYHLIKSFNDKDPSLNAKVETFATLPPTAVSKKSLLAEVVQDSHESVLGSSPKIIFKPAYMDSTHLNRYGVQTVIYGPAGRCKTIEFGWAPEIGEHVYIPDLVLGAKVYAMAALAMCSRERNSAELVPDPFAGV
jgi:acetylornithine deacetylase